ncbi:MAG: hypothetical protein AB8B65_11585 [Kordia sp.]|uniref:hypothetical protein n=1 Tax=Kordia sp. TaxID=1965332 RepID=UPI00385EA958
MLEELTEPKATAIYYMNHTESFGFTEKELCEFVMLLMIPAFFDILINKYEDHIEFIISVSKTDNEYLKIHRMHVFHNTIEHLSNVVYETLENSYSVGKEYDILTAKCKLDAINQ